MIRAAAAVAVVALGALLWLVVRDPYGGRTLFVHRGAPAFTVLYRAPALRRVPGGLLHLRSRRGELIVLPQPLAPYRGDVTGVLPAVAEARIRRLAARLPRFTLTADARDSVHGAPAYGIAYRYAGGSGSDLLVVPSRRAPAGLWIDVRQGRPAAALSAAQQSFAFGTERP